jgi:hypothetical protein
LSEKNKDIIKENIAILKEMIDFCLDAKYRLVLITIPTTKEIDQTKQYLKNILATV